MATKQGIIDYLLEQLSAAGSISARKMFGEYAIYCKSKVVALVCDDQLFVKPTNAGRSFIGKVVEKPAYPGAKPSFYISGDAWEDADWLSDLVKITCRELPEPKKKSPRKKRAKT